MGMRRKLRKTSTPFSDVRDASKGRSPANRQENLIEDISGRFLPNFFLLSFVSCIIGLYDELVNIFRRLLSISSFHDLFSWVSSIVSSL